MDLGRQEVMDAIFYDCSIDLPFIKNSVDSATSYEIYDNRWAVIDTSVGLPSQILLYDKCD